MKFEAPIHAIEFKTFIRVLSKIDNISFSVDELKELAKGCDSFYLGKEELSSYKQKPDFILYDRFLLAVRGATMNEQEIKMQMNWQEPVEEEPPEEEDPIVIEEAEEVQGPKIITVVKKIIKPRLFGR